MVVLQYNSHNEIYRNYCKPAIIGITLLLIITLIIAPSIKGAGRWINLGIVSFQPADIARLVLLMHLAFMLDDKKDKLDDLHHAYIPMFIWVIVISTLIILQPNISTGLILVLVSLTILYVGGARLKHVLSSLVLFFMAGGIAAMIYSHSRERILSFINSWQNGSDINLQVKHHPHLLVQH